MMVGDLYETLGVAGDDGASSIRHAYDDLTRQHRVATDAVSSFRRAVERAFEALADTHRRLAYDLHHALAAAAEAEETTLDLLRDFAGERPSRDEVRSAFCSNFSAEGPPKSGRVEVLDLQLGVERPAIHELVLLVPVFHPCPACHGAGVIELYACDACDGSGLAEARAPVRATARATAETLLPLQALGIRSPVLRVRIVKSS